MVSDNIEFFNNFKTEVINPLYGFMSGSTYVISKIEREYFVTSNKPNAIKLLLNAYGLLDGEDNNLSLVEVSSRVPFLEKYKIQVVNLDDLE